MTKYKAFISYSHASDNKLAAALQSALHRFVKPWYRLRALRVFRDKTNLSVNPALWSSVEKALSESEYFILLANPQAAVSKWVGKELEYWLGNKSAHTLLIILTEGELVWDLEAGDFDWDKTSALPRILKSIFKEEPLYLDFRKAKTSERLSLNHPEFRDGIGEIAATLHGRAKDQLVGEDVRLHKKALRLAWSAAIALVILALSASTAAYLAIEQRNIAIERLAESLFAQGNALVNAGRYEYARKSYLEAREAFLHANVSSMPADVALSDVERRAPPPIHTFAGHNSSVLSVAFSADGRLALSGGVDKEVKLWDVERGCEIQTLGRHDDWVTCVVFSPNGWHALSASRDKTVKLWDIEKRSEIRPFSGHTLPIWSIALSPDGRRALSGGDDRGVKLWDVDKGVEILTIGEDTHEHIEWICNVKFSSDGLLAFSSSRDGAIKVWDTQTWKMLRSFGHSGRLNCATISNDDRFVLTAEDDKTVRLWDIESGDELRSFTPFLDDPILSSALFPDGRLALLGSRAGRLTIWDLEKGREVTSFSGHTSAVTAVALSSDSRLAISSSDDSTAKIWLVETGGRLLPFSEHTTGVHTVAFSPTDSRLALSGSRDGAIRLWDVQTGRGIHLFDGHKGPVNSIAFSLDGRLALSSGADKTVRLWDIKNGTEVRTLGEHSDIVISAAFSSDGHLALSTSKNGEVKVWDVDGSDEPRTFETDTINTTLMMAFSPDGRLAIVSRIDENQRPNENLELWDMKGERMIGFFDAPVDIVEALAFSSDGRLALSGDVDRLVRLWDVETRRQVYSFEGHIDNVTAVAFSPDGRSALSGSRDRTVMLWDLEKKRLIRSFSGHAEGIQSVAFSPDGNSALTASDDLFMKFWIFSFAEGKLELEKKKAEASETLRHVPHDGASLATLGDWYASRKVFDWAINYLELARSNGSQQVSSLTLAQCYWQKDEIVKARRELRRDLERNPGERDKFYVELCLKALENSLAGAGEDTTEVAPDSIASEQYMLVARSHVWMGLYEDALRYFDWAILVDPGNKGAYLQRLQLKIYLGDLEGAIADRTKMIKLDRANYNAYFARGVLKQRLNNYHGAIYDYTKAIQLEPGDENTRRDLYYNRAMARQAIGDYDHAVDDYTKAIELDPDFLKAYNNRGNVFNAKGDYDRAIADFTRSIELDHDQSYVEHYNGRGLAKSHNDDFESALVDLTEAIRLSPNFVGAYHNRARVKQVMGDDQGAIDDFTTAIHLFYSKKGTSYMERGYSHYNKRLWKVALTDFKTAYELGTRVRGNVQFYIWLIRTRLGQRDKATEELQRYFKEWQSREADGNLPGSKEKLWHQKIADFLADRIAQAELLHSAESQSKKIAKINKCDAYFYAGMKRLIEGDKETAIAYLQQSIETKQYWKFEYHSAVAEVKRLHSTKK